MATIDGADILVTGPNGYSQRALATANEVNAALNAVYVNYSIAPPNVGWTVRDNGVYTVTLLPNQIFDSKGRPAEGRVLGTFKVDLYGDNLGFTRSLYRSILGRDGDNDGLAGYQERLNNGEAREAIAREIWESEEHRTMQVQQFYRELLNREAEAEGVAYWVERFKQGATEEEVMAGIAGSREALDNTETPTGFTNFVYDQLLGRRPVDDAANFVQAVESNAAGAVKDVALSEEALERRMNELYRTILMRDADDEGRRWFVSQSRDHGGYGEAAIKMLASGEYFQLHGSAV
jgi:hypothetical protein